jgi:hypothetical protein
MDGFYGGLGSISETSMKLLKISVTMGEVLLGLPWAPCQRRCFTNQTNKQNMIKQLSLALLLAAPVFAGPSKAPIPQPQPPPAPPAGPSFDNIGLGYSRGIESDSNGIGLGTSYSFTDNLFGEIGLGLSGADSLSDFSATTLLGGHISLAPTTALYAKAGALFLVPDKGDDDVVFTASTGVATMLGSIEADLAATYVGTDNDAWIGSLNFWVPVAGKIDLGIGAATDLDNTDSWSLNAGFRFRFK